MDNLHCCAVLGHFPMRFAWGFDEEAEGCRRLKLELAQQIMELRQQGVTQFAVVADCGVGMHAGEIVNVLHESDDDLMLFCVTPHEERATKWAPYLRERYFNMLAACTRLDAISLCETPSCEYDAYQRIIDYADIILAVYDLASVRGDVIDQAMYYAKSHGKPIVYIHPDTFEVS